MKLFGKCKFEGLCICGNCAYAPINKIDAVKVTKSDGSTATIEAPTLPPDTKSARRSYNTAIFAQKTHSGGTYPEPKPDSRVTPNNIKQEGQMTPSPNPGRNNTPYPEQNRKRCAACSLILRKDHKCKSAAKYLLAYATAPEKVATNG